MSAIVDMICKLEDDDADINYFRRQLVTAIKLPPKYLGFNEPDLEEKKIIMLMDHIWSAFCMTWVSVAWAMLVGRD